MKIILFNKILGRKETTVQEITIEGEQKSFLIGKYTFEGINCSVPFDIKEVIAIQDNDYSVMYQNWIKQLYILKKEVEDKEVSSKISHLIDEIKQMQIYEEEKQIRRSVL